MKNNEDISIGDIVYLTSGGPPMSVKKIKDDQVIVIQGNGAQHLFPLPCVTKIKPTHLIVKVLGELSNILRDENT